MGSMAEWQKVLNYMEATNALMRRVKDLEDKVAKFEADPPKRRGRPPKEQAD